MGDQAIRYYMAPYHTELIGELVEVATKEFGRPNQVELISKNKVYRLHYPDKTMKARVWEEKPFCLHRHLLEEGHNLPKIIKTVSRGDKATCWQFTEWVEGDNPVRRLRVREEAQLAIPPDEYYQIGEILGELSNININGKYVGMRDVVWNNFTVDERGRVRIIDTSKLYTDECPERWAFHYVLFNQHVTRAQKRAFADGYISKVKPNVKRLEQVIHAINFMKDFNEKLASFVRV